jgi:hypothetical protein
LASVWVVLATWHLGHGGVRAVEGVGAVPGRRPPGDDILQRRRVSRRSAGGIAPIL